jgi:hypothetical protein
MTIHLSKKDEKKIVRAAKKVEPGDLYRALHRVGDDSTKSEIETVLREMLEPETLKRVIAVFKIATETK